MSKREFRLAEMRKRAGMTQMEVARTLQVPRPRYGDWERETTTLNLRDAIRLADLFNCSLDDLAGHTAPNQPPITPNEQVIVDAYRIADEKQQRIKLAHARIEIEMAETEALEKKDGIQAG